PKDGPDGPGPNRAAGRRGRRRSAYEAPRAAADRGPRLGGAESKPRRRPRLPAPPSRVTLLVPDLVPRRDADGDAAAAASARGRSDRRVSGRAARVSRAGRPPPRGRPRRPRGGWAGRAGAPG